MIKRSRKYIIYGIILLLVVGLSVGFSAFQKQLLIDDSIFEVRLHEDVRVSNSVLSKVSGNAVSNFEDYNKNKILGNITFSSTSSYVLYKVDLTNYGNIKSGLLGISSNTTGVNYSICDSNGSNCTNDPRTSVCNGSNCTLGSTKEIYVKVTSSSTGTKNIDFDLNFKPYRTITYDNFLENTSSFPVEIMEDDSIEVTLTGDVEDVGVTGEGYASYNKTTHKLTITGGTGNMIITAKYLLTDLAETSYTGTDPDNYVLFGTELYRIITKENIDDGYSNIELRAKIIKDSSIGQYAFDTGNNGYFDGSSLKDVLNTTYYGSLTENQQNLIDTAKWGFTGAGLDPVVITYSTVYFALINVSDFNNNSSWLNFNQYIMYSDDVEDNYVDAIINQARTRKTINTLVDTHPTTYLSKDVLVIGGTGTRANPYQIEKKGDGLLPNPTKIEAKTLTVTGSYQQLLTVTNETGTVYYSTTTQLNSSNYTSGTTTRPTGRNVGNYTVYYYIPAGSVYKAKADTVYPKINGITYSIAYTKNSTVSAIGKNSDTCTTTGYSLTCNVTLPSITPATGYENGKWYSGANSYNTGSSFALNSSNNGTTLTAKATGKTYVATFMLNGSTSLTGGSTCSGGSGDACVSCNVTSGSTCTVTSPTITRDGFTIDGWSTSSNANSGTTAGGAITLSGNTTYYAITHKTVTLTFNKNGNTSQTPSGGSASTATTIIQTCDIWNTATTCNITSPTITMSGSTIKGYTTGATTYSDYWQVNTQKVVSANNTWYAQSIKPAIDRTMTLYRNGNTSFAYNGTTYTDTSKTFTVCTIPEAHNDAQQATSCTASIATFATINPASGFTNIGWSTSSTNRTATYTSGQTNVSITMSSNRSFYAQSSKSSINRTITFYRNGNTSFTYNGTTTTGTSRSITACTIPAVYNGATQDSSCTATITTFATITAPSGFTNIGWSTGATNRTATYTSGQTNVSITMDSNKSYYAQSSKASIDRTITFYRNGNTSFTYNGTTTTGTSRTITACTIPTVYNGATQDTSCTASITTFATITAPSGFTALGWSAGSTDRTIAYTSGQSNVSITMDSNKSYFAQSSKGSIDRTITFYRNGNTSFTYSGTTTTGTSRTVTVCTIPAVYNGATQDSSCTATIATFATINPASGFTNIGWSTGETNRTATYTSGQTNVSITMDSNKSYYAQSIKNSIDRTLTLYKNGNTSFTYGSTYTDNSKTFTLCTIPAVYNGATQNTSCTRNISIGTIVAPTGFTALGWSAGANDRTIVYTPGQTINGLVMTGNLSYYAQSSKAAVDRTITFYRNGNTSFTYGGTTTTGTSRTITACTIPVVYNGETQDSSCTATIATFATITAPSGFTNIGWSTGATNSTATYTSGQTNVSITMDSNKSYYAQSIKAAKTITMTFYRNGNTSQTKYGGSASTATSITDSCTIDAVYNGATQSTTCNITSPTITPPSGFTVLGYSDSSSSTTITWNHNTSKAVSENKSYYAQSSKDLTATFYYNSNTTSGQLTVSTTTATCTLLNNATSCTVSVPTAVSSSVGKYNSAYKGVNTAKNMSSGSLSISADTNFHANYSSKITIYYPNSSDGVSSIDTALYRNEYFNSSNPPTDMIVLTSTSNSSTTQATSVTLSSIKGTFQGLNTSRNTTTYYTVNDSSNVIDKNTKTFYAVTTASENVTFKYNNNTTCASATVTTTTSSVTSTYYCTNTTTMGTSHGTTTTVPTAVQNSKGQYNSTYRAMANVNSLSAVTTFTGGSTYYAVYSSDVTNYYYRSSYTSRTIYRNEYLAASNATTYTSVLATSNTGKSNYSTANGPSSASWYGLADTSTTTRKYDSVESAATSNTCTTNLYTIYSFNATYQKGSNVSSIGSDSGVCYLKHDDTSCNVTLPSITPNTGYTSSGWSTTNGATVGVIGTYKLTTNNRTLYANAVIANYINTTTNLGYESLKDAFDNVVNNQTIKVLNNVTETTATTLASDKTGIKLDLNGKTITMSSIYFTNRGSLDIYNTSSTTGTINGGGASYLITNYGTMSLNGTSTSKKILIEKTSGQSNTVIYNYSGTLTMYNNVEIKVNVSSNYGIVNYPSGTLTVNGGTISSSSSPGIYNQGTTTINGGTINGHSSALSNQKGTTTITGGTIQGEQNGITNSYEAQLIISAGTITGSTQLGISNCGTATTTGGTITGKYDGIDNHQCQDFNSNTIYGKITLGTKDSTVSTSSPVVQTTGTSSKYGVKNNTGCTFNFYDGVIKSSSGTGYSISGTVSDKPSGYTVNKTTSSGVETAKLVSSSKSAPTNDIEEGNDMILNLSQEILNIDSVVKKKIDEALNEE